MSIMDKNQTVTDEPAMVMGFIPTILYNKLRIKAAEEGCSESHLVSEFVKQALISKKRRTRRDTQ